MTTDRDRTVDDEPTQSRALWPYVTAAGLLVLATGWAYWPALTSMVAAWIDNPDYSHGFLVAPLAALFLWLRRDKLAASDWSPSWLGLAALVVVTGVRAFSGLYYLGPVDAWTLPITFAGIVLLVFGWPCLKWSLPSLAFLYFMIPIPYSAETWLSVPLQRVATRLSTDSLQLLGQPAIAEGNVILLGDDPLMVAEACSGLRIMVGILALAFAFVLFSGWTWWQKALVVLAAVPVALVANTLRIVTTGLLQQYVSSEVADRFTHDLAGLMMIPVAAALFWLLLIYLDRLFPKVQVVSPAAAFRSASDRG